MTANRREDLPWVDLDELAGTSAEAAGNSQPSGQENASALQRRDFLKILGLGGLASAALAACERLPVSDAIPYLVAPEDVTPGVAAHYASTCSACPAACGLLVTVRDGRPVKLEGNPDHPLSGGGLCAQGQADLRALYDAGRLREPTVDGAGSTWSAVDGRVTAGLAAARSAGQAIYLLSPTAVSPTARAVIDDLLAPLGGLHVQYDPGPERASARLRAYELLDGQAVEPALEIGAADLLVVLGSDLLTTGSEPVAHTRSYAARRRAGGAPFHHVQLEGSLSNTGAGADQRWQATAGERRAAALWLLNRVAVGVNSELARQARATLGAVAPPAALAARLETLGASLLKHPGHSLITSGSNDLTEQLAVALCNRLLGNEGHSLHLEQPSLVAAGRDEALEALLAAIEAGQVGALIVLGLDPVEQLPTGATLSGKLSTIPLVVTLDHRATATARASTVVAAAHHGLECWGDFQPRETVITLAQPAIRPLFDTRDPIESLLRWSGAQQTDHRALLMDRWRTQLAAAPFVGGFEAQWVESVSAGVLPVPPKVAVVEPPVVEPEAPVEPVEEAPEPAEEEPAPDPYREVLAVLAAPGAAPSGGDALEIDLVQEVGVGDGRRAFVPWLRELPDPLTRVSWEPCVRVSPARARALGVDDGDVLSIEAGGHRIAMATRIMPGQHSQVLAVPVGYGRSDGDGGDASLNAYGLASFTGGQLSARGLAAAVSVTAEQRELPLLQTHPSAEGRPVVHQVVHADQAPHVEHHGPHRSLWTDRDEEGQRWEMVIDLDACTGCSACVVACQAENNLPVVGPEEIAKHRDMYWLRIDRYFMGDAEDPQVLFEPMLCAQCANASCETVCPVAATVHSKDGLSQQVYNRCVGTRYCANNCPYKMRRFNWFDHDMGDPLERMVLNPDVVVRERGVMEKCSFCVQRIQAARIEARREGRAAYEVQTACQQSCPARAISFGDGSDPEGVVAAHKHDPRAFRVLAETGVDPSVTYLARVRRDGADSAHGDHPPAHGDHS